MNKTEKELSRRIENIRNAVHRIYDLTGTPWEDDQHSAPEQKNTQEEDQPGVRSLAVPVAAPKNTEHTKRRNTKPIPWWKKALLKIREWLTLKNIGILAVIVYAIVTYLQWKDLRHNFEVDQRSWLKIGYSWPNPTSAAPATAILTFQNVGKSVVTTVYGESSFDVVESGSPPLFSLERRHNTTNQAAMFPTDANITRVDLWDQTTKTARGFTDMEIQNLLAGKSYVAVYGIVFYIDQFGFHWYRFCNWHAYSTVDSTANAAECIVWNRVGDGVPNVPYEK